MTIDTQLEYLTQAIEDQEPPITKQEMEQMLDTVQKSKQVSSYRQVDEAPVVVDVVDISDAAAKKLAQKLKPSEVPTQINTKTTEKPDGFLSMVLDFAKGSFVNIIKMIGGVVGWVVGTVTGILSSVTNWVLGKIQKAMIRAVAKSASNMGGRFSKLGLIAKVAGAGAAGLAAWNIYEGFDNFQSKITGANDVVTSAFANPENILSTGSTTGLPAPSSSSSTNTTEPDTGSSDSLGSSTPIAENEDVNNIALDSQESTEMTLDPNTSEIVTPPATEISDNQNNNTLDLVNNFNTTNIDPSSQITNNTTVSDLTELSSEEAKQIQEFIDVNDMFDKNSDTVVNDMRDILNESQTQVNLTPGSSTPTGGSMIPALPTRSSTIPTNMSLPSVETSTDTLVDEPKLRSSTSNLNNDVDVAGDQSTDISELYNDVKNQTTDVVNVIRQKTDNSSFKQSVSGSPSSSSPLSTRPSPRTSPGVGLQSISQPTSSSSAQAIDNSNQSIQSTTQLNTNTNNLHKTSVDLSTKIENLNKRIANKQAPKIIHTDNTQSATSTDYLTDSDTVRSLARSRL